MEKPNVQVIRFQEQDIIATSGGQALSPNENYFALKSEAEQAGVGIIDEDNVGGTWVSFNDVLLQYKYVYVMDGKDFERYSGTFKYAWFDKDQWWTNDKTVADLGYTYYDDASNLPTGD